MRQAYLSITLVLLTLFQAYAFSYAKNKNEISEKNKSLFELQDKLRQKKNEKEQYLREENRISRELDTLSNELKKNQDKGERIRREIIKAEANLSLASKELDSSRWEKNRWADTINSEIGLWYRENLSYNKLFDDTVDEKFRVEAIEQKRNYFSNALDREINWQISFQRWKNAKSRLSNLKSKQEDTARQKSAIQKREKKVLETTVGSRLMAEKEIQELTESAKAMRELIARLELERKKKAKAKKTKAKPAPTPKRRSLSWPVKGKVLTKFGKNKHPYLDTYVISNGIRISAHTGDEVSAAYKGEVVFTGEFRTYGLMIILDNGGGLYTIYGHLGAINVLEGAKVKEGEIMGQITASDNPVLYFEVRYKGQVDDPLLWLSAGYYRGFETSIF